MKLIYSYIMSVFAALLITACAAHTPPQSPVGQLPPPGFPVSMPISGQICGGMAPNQQGCAAGQYCHRPIAAICGAADAPGQCRTLPQMCTQDYSPVCGCDGRTYSNECAANSQGVSAGALGPCR